MNRSAAPSIPSKTIPEFIAYAKANPRQTQLGGGRRRTDSPFVGERFNVMTGVNLVHVPYRGAGTALRWRLPDIPTVAEFVPDYESSYWTGGGAPRNTPAEIVGKP